MFFAAFIFLFSSAYISVYVSICNFEALPFWTNYLSISNYFFIKDLFTNLDIKNFNLVSKLKESF